MRGILTIVAAVLFLPSALGAEEGISIRIVPNLLSPGEAFLVRVNAGSPVTGMSGEVFGKKLYFMRRGTEYVALSGVDLFQEPGTYQLRVEAGPEGAVSHEGWVRRIKVARKKFGKEVLYLPERVFLSDEELKRVAQEKQELDKIWREELPKDLWAGPFVLPVRGSFGSKFGVRRIINGEPRSPHMGQDIKAPEGTPVAACNAGKVVFTGEQFFSGKSIVIDHGHGLYSMYFHLSEILVREGDEVGREQVIGKVGATGRAIGPHLHWGMRLQDMRVDPMSLLSLPLNEVQR